MKKQLLDLCLGEQPVSSVKVPVQADSHQIHFYIASGPHTHQTENESLAAYGPHYQQFRFAFNQIPRTTSCLNRPFSVATLGAAC
ncbi:MAG: hypothetical protein PHI97_07455 [Desulfobulbus sp.]|nr:hypothetical protein [Desulfobulbus sp.]